jgi:hypothetical protein
MPTFIVIVFELGSFVPSRFVEKTEIELYQEFERPANLLDDSAD